MPLERISGPMVTDATLTGADIQDGSIATADLADAAVTTAKLADAAVSTAKLADSGVTRAKLGEAGRIDNKPCHPSDHHQWHQQDVHRHPLLGPPRHAALPWRLDHRRKRPAGPARGRHHANDQWLRPQPVDPQLPQRDRQHHVDGRHPDLQQPRHLRLHRPDRDRTDRPECQHLGRQRHPDVDRHDDRQRRLRWPDHPLRRARDGASDDHHRHTDV